jgi:hypothetical protein
VAHLQRSRSVRRCQVQRTRSRAVSYRDSRCCCRNALFILRICHRTNRHGKAGSMRAVRNPRYEICPGRPIYSFCLQLACSQRRLLVERNQQGLLCLPRAASVGRPGRRSCRGNHVGMSHSQSALAVRRNSNIFSKLDFSARMNWGSSARQACLTRCDSLRRPVEYLKHDAMSPTLAESTDRVGLQANILATFRRDLPRVARTSHARQPSPIIGCPVPNKRAQIAQ